MKNLNRLILIATSFLILSGLYSCDEVTKSYLEDKSANNNDSGLVRKVIIEDYTGFKCGNCPPGHVEAQRLQEEYGDKLIVIAVHPDNGFTKPTVAHPYDFRTETGTEWSKFFGISSLPNGMVNRRGYKEGNYLFKQGSWQQLVDEELEKKPVVSLEISSVYLEGSRQILVFVTYVYQEELTKYHNLNVCIVEDSIINYQLWYGHDPVDIPDYVHNHVLRKGLNGTWGEELNTPIGIKTYSYTIPENSDWRPEKLKIVAFISDVGNTYEVLQAEEVQLVR